MNMHAEECWAHEKLREARMEAARQNLVSSLQESRPFRVSLGLALIRTGRWLAGPAPAQPKRLAA